MTGEEKKLAKYPHVVRKMRAYRQQVKDLQKALMLYKTMFESQLHRAMWLEEERRKRWLEEERRGRMK